MIVKRLIALLLLLLPFCYGDENVDFDLVADKFSQLQTVSQKMETAPVAYYGTHLERVLYSIDDKQKLELKVAKNYPQVYKAFVDWSAYKQKMLNERLAQAPEKYRRIFEKRNAAIVQHGYFLIHDLILVEKIYDKTTKKWVTPKPEESRKSLFYMAYVGTDISMDSSSWKFSQRLMNLLVVDEFDVVRSSDKKRIFFLDGFSQECDNLTDSSTFENLRYYPVRLKYYVPENPAVEVREKMQVLIENGNYAAADMLADSADLAPRSKIILKILNRDYDFILNKDSTMYYLDNYNNYYYVDGLDSALDKTVRRAYEEGSYCETVQNVPDVDASAVCDVVEKVALYKQPQRIYKEYGDAIFNGSIDLGQPSLKGNFSDYNPLLYVGFNLNFSFENWVYGIELTFHILDAHCDSCGTLDIGFQGVLGYTWLKSKYIEGVVFGNLGFAGFAGFVSSGKTDEKKKSISAGENYFRYGIGTYFDLLFPNFIGKPVPYRGHTVTRYGVRLKLGFMNMNNTRNCQAHGILPYISLGFTWHTIFGMITAVDPSYRPRKYYQAESLKKLDYVYVD